MQNLIVFKNLLRKISIYWLKANEKKEKTLKNHRLQEIFLLFSLVVLVNQSEEIMCCVYI